MKHLFFWLAMVIAGVVANAQDFQGIAVYESKTTFNLDEGKTENETEGDQLPPEIEAQIQEQLKKAFEKTYILEFDKVASLYREEEKLEKPSGSGMNISISINSSEGGLLYKNLKEKRSVTETEFFGKEFLITDSLSKTKWNLSSSETKKIGNYTCYKATAIIKPTEEEKEDKAIVLTETAPKEITITAWYTPEIPVGHGPGNYWGLPGLILEVNDGHTALLCSKITLRPKEKLVIKAPKKGSKVTKAEYDKIVDEKTNEMMEMEEGPSEPGTQRTTRVLRIGG